MRVVICDDEKLARERLVRLVEHLRHEVVAQAKNGKEAIDLVEQFQPDVILLDLRMPEIDGLACAKKLSQFTMPPAIIFCTAFDEYALDAFKANANDYLLKPISINELQQALDKVTRLTQAQTQTIAQIQNTIQPEVYKKQHITARTYKGMELIPLDDIYYFLADQKYVVVRYKHGQVLIDGTLKDLETQFAQRFIRIHRNALLSLKYLDGLEIVDGHYQARLKEIDDRLLISRRHISILKERMQSL